MCRLLDLRLYPSFWNNSQRPTCTAVQSSRYLHEEHVRTVSAACPPTLYRVLGQAGNIRLSRSLRCPPVYSTVERTR